MEKITKEFILKKMMETWISDNPSLLQDISDLAYTLTMFNSKWGTKLKPIDFINPKDTSI